MELDNTEPALSVLIPLYNDVAALSRLLPQLTPLAPECVVIDAGSTDNGPALAMENGVQVLTTVPGRGQQLALGVAAARGRWLWMLHADSELSPASVATVQALIRTREVCWGRFDVRLRGSRRLLSLVAWFMNRRSCLTGICTGDQGIIVHRQLLDACGGVPRQSLMEDIELSRRLRRLGRPRCFPATLVTSARRWERDGITRTVFRMWRLRWRYFMGADPEALYREYYDVRR